MTTGARKTAKYEALVRLLERAPVFAGLGPEARLAAAALAAPRSFGRGDTVANDGEDWPRVLLVAEGRVRMVKGSESGRVLAAVTLAPGEVFFSQTLFDGKPLPASLEAETQCLVYLWDGPGLVRLIKDSPEALWQLAATLVQQTRKAAGVIDSLAFQPLPQRLARLLLERFGGAGAEPAPRSMTLDEMAAHIGTTREVVCRLLYRFADEGLISITRTDLNLRDRDRLAGLARDS